MITREKLLTLIIGLLLGFSAFSQEKSTIYGTVTDTTGSPVSMVNITIQGTKFGVSTDKYGRFSLEIPLSGDVMVVFSCLGYRTSGKVVTLKSGTRIEINKVMEIAYENIGEVNVNAQQDKSGIIKKINSKTFTMLPNLNGNIENLLRMQSGVSNNNELSSQYSVRGGSFDENLIYVNDIEIYRPFLIRTGQQEGLSFVNPDLVSSLNFSAGGFDVSYGDKMSSVLDVTYKRPTSNQGSASVSLLEQTFHYEGVNKSQRFHYIFGIRNKTTQYLLSSLDTKGEYQPQFSDVQAYITYDLKPNLDISFLGNFSQNVYNFIPKNQNTEFGTFTLPLQLLVYFDGGEHDKFQTGVGALTLNYHPTSELSLKLIASDYSSTENENFDLLGQYWINELDKSSAKGSDSAINLAVGSYLNHARNSLDANVFSATHIGSFKLDDQRFKWGLTFQRQQINDHLSEWTMVDSAGYSVPNSTDKIQFQKAARAINSEVFLRTMGYLMYNYEFEHNFQKYYITAGIRGNYWDFNKEFIYSPRASISIKPNWKHDFLFYFATGAYDQPVFYKEMRDPQGNLNRNVKSQKSYHFVLGADYLFYSWERPFKFTTEMYYKLLYDLIPYKIDNLQMEYDGHNRSKGYAAGMDFKLNGEFVPGTESWMSLSLLRSYEKIQNDAPEYLPRPTDQLINFSLFFQDYLPHNPSYKVHFSLHYGSPLPVVVPGTSRYDQIYRMPPYRRVDVGFSKQIKSSDQVLSPSNPFRFLKDAWISAEIFNVIGINNTMSFQWLKTVSNVDGVPGEIAVPNYLTSRRFNVKLIANF